MKNKRQPFFKYCKEENSCQYVQSTYWRVIKWHAPANKQIF